MNSLSIIIIDDNPSQREILSGFLSKIGHKVIACENGEAGINAVRKNYIDLIITDFRMPGINGLEVLKQVKEINPEIQVMIITAYGTIEDSVEAMRLGAWDYLSKPVDLEELRIKLEKVAAMYNLLQENQVLRSQLQTTTLANNIIYQSPEMEAVMNFIARVSNSTASVLIQGESGTGKELVAKAIHYSSDRKKDPFIPVNCAAIPETLFESEIFGHEKGAYTGAHERHKGYFEMANGGTLFLDEVADIPLNFQVKLLRAIQEKEFSRLGSSQTITANVRIISASNKNIQKMVSEDKFRSDLFFRLNVIPITIPPLRERKSDIPLLVNHFIKKYVRLNNIKIKDITPEAMDHLVRYEYPGNVRELENIIERTVILTRDSVITKDDVPLDTPHATEVSLSSTMDEQVSSLEKRLIIKALTLSNYVQTVAAEKLGISERVLRYKMKKYNLTSPKS